MTFEELKQEIEKIINPYLVGFKLAKLICSLEIDERDWGVYDPWEYNSPVCYSYIINFVNTKLKISINPNDLECVFEIKERDNDEAKALFFKLYKEYSNREKADFSRFYYYGRDYHLLAYANNHKLFLQILKDYFQTVYREVS